MRLCKIRHMDVIPHAGAIPRFIIRSEHIHRRALPVRHLKHNGDKVRLRRMRLADAPAHMGAAGIKVPQGDEFYAVRHIRPVEHVLHGKLCFAIWVCGDGAVFLADRDPLRLSVYGCRGRKDDSPHALLRHGRKQRTGASDIVVVILQRLHHAFPHERIRGKMDHRIRRFALQHAVNKCAVPHVAFVKARLRVHRRPVAGLQAVRHRHVIPLLDQCINGMRADVTRTAQHKDFHESCPPKMRSAL